MSTENGAAAPAFVEQARHILTQEYTPRLLRCLDEMSEEDVWWRPDGPCNSAGNLILHLCGNVRQWIISGVGSAPDRRERAKEFAERGPIPKAALRERLLETLREAEQALAEFNPARLTEPKIIQGFDTTNLKAILHVVEHFGQHLGQIIYLTKMRKGIDLRFYNL